MAQLAAAAILTRVREVVEDAAGSVRIVTADTYRPGAHEAQNPDAASTEALVKPRAEARFTTIEPHSSRPPIQGSFTLYAVELEVTVTRFLGTEHMILPDVRTALRAVAAEDASRIAQALEWPGQLDETGASVATGLVSGMLRHVSSEVGDLETVEGQNGRIVTVHTFSGTARINNGVAPANTTAPSIVGDSVEVGAELLADTGEWSGTEQISYSYQWLRDAVAIGGATSSSYTLALADVGTTITLTVTASNPWGSASATSAGVGPVAPAP